MKTNRIQEHRNATLKLYKELEKARSEANNDIPESVAASHTNLEKNRFLLAIVGKVSAGKSTFINALLKQDLLPTDALQATAAIIEIFHSKKPFLRVTYTDGHADEINPDESEDHMGPLTQKLREVAAIQKEDRELPFAKLNDFIIERYDTKTERAEWDQTEQEPGASKTETISILDLFLESGLPNIHKISDDVFRDRCRSYLKSNRDGRKIAKQIEVGIPFPENKRNEQPDHFRIVDTPGIGAEGGFADRTLEFLINADAVVYIHRGDPSETILHDALKNILPERVKKHMLLVLTHKCDNDEETNEKILDEMQKSFREQIPSERIFLVDSLTDRALQTYYDAKGWDELDKLRKRDTKNHKAWKKVTAPAYEDSEGDFGEFLDRLESQSDMRSIREAVQQMSEKSLGIQIGILLGSMTDLFAELEAEAAANADIHAVNLKDPEQFAAEMDRLTNTMKQYEADAKEGISEIQTQFDLSNTKRRLGKTLGKLIDEAESQIDVKSFASEDPAKTADDFLFKIKQDVEDGFAALSKDIETELRETMNQMQVGLQGKYIIAVPKIPLDRILERQREEAVKSVPVTVKRNDFFGKLLRLISFGTGGTVTREERRFDATHYFKSARSAMKNELMENKSGYIRSVRNEVGRACDNYKVSVTDKIRERQNLIDKLKSDEMDNNSLKTAHDIEMSRVKFATEAIEECITIQNDL